MLNIFILQNRINVGAEAPILWPPDAKSQLIRKDQEAGKDWRQEEKGMTEDEMVGCLHWLNGHVFEQDSGDGNGQESLACCSPWGCKSDMTEQLNTTTNLLEVGHQVKTHKQYYLILFQVERPWLHPEACWHCGFIQWKSEIQFTWDSMQDSWNCCVSA